MTTRSYAFAFQGRITVDETTLKAAILAFEFVAEPGDPEVDDDEKLEISQRLLGFVEQLPPDRRLQLYLANGPFRGLSDRIGEQLRSDLPDATVAVEGVTVTLLEQPRRR